MFDSGGNDQALLARMYSTATTALPEAFRRFDRSFLDSLRNDLQGQINERRAAETVMSQAAAKAIMRGSGKGQPYNETISGDSTYKEVELKAKQRIKLADEKIPPLQAQIAAVEAILSEVNV